MTKKTKRRPRYRQIINPPHGCCMGELTVEGLGRFKVIKYDLFSELDDTGYTICAQLVRADLPAAAELDEVSNGTYGEVHGEVRRLYRDYVRTFGGVGSPANDADPDGEVSPSAL